MKLLLIIGIVTLSVGCTGPAKIARSGDPSVLQSQVPVNSSTSMPAVSDTVHEGPIAGAEERSVRSQIMLVTMIVITAAVLLFLLRLASSH